MWPTPSITLGTGKPKLEPPGAVGAGGMYKPGDKAGEIKPEEKIKQVMIVQLNLNISRCAHEHMH